MESPLKIKALLACLMLMATPGMLFAAPTSTPAASPSQAAASGENLDSRLRAALRESEPRLGTLEPWQERIFQEEVLPQSRRFIRNYHASGSGVEVDVDFDSLRNYLKFYAPKALKTTDPRIAVFLRPDENCEKCVSATPEVRKLLNSRLESRGFKPLWLDSSDLGPTVPAGSALNERVSEIARQKSAPAWATLQWRLTPAEDLDSAHAEENQFRLSLALGLPGVPVQGGDAVLLDEDRFDTAASRVLTDAFSALGERSDKDFSGGSGEGAEAATLVITGFHDFQTYSSARLALQNRLAELFPTTPFEIRERKLSRGRAELLLYGDKKNEQIKQAITSSDLGGKVKLEVK